MQKEFPADDSVVKASPASVGRNVMRDVEDDALVECARNGDAEAFALLYYRYKLDIWNMAYFQLRNHHEAEDSLQETFLRAYRALGQYRRSETARPWLLTICRNVCLDRLRASRRRPVLSLEELEEPAMLAVDHDRRIDFRRALAQLPADDLEAFFVVDVMGCRSEEAARILGLRASSTLRSRVARARRALAPALGDGPQVARSAPFAAGSSAA
jgi:RNA polymerase sigma-70 factor (ECF subfamily)